MLDTLKFVQGAVGKKDLIPALTHYRIKDGVIKSFNGSLSLSAPIDLDIDCLPKAVPFYKAIQKCGETIKMTLTKTGRLSIVSGKFRANIECLDEEVAHDSKPQGKVVDVNGEEFLAGLKACFPFISSDASRPWSNGILINAGTMTATNNVTVIEYWLGASLPYICNIPKDAVKEMIRINKPPIKIMSDDKSISFVYNKDQWIKTQLLDASWPSMDKIFAGMEQSEFEDLNPELFEALDNLKDFTDEQGRIYFNDGKVLTSLVNDSGASYEIEGFDHKGAYQIQMLNLLRKNITHVDFTRYPKPCFVMGKNLRGAIVGMRQ